jgi:hypothetical protein
VGGFGNFDLRGLPGCSTFIQLEIPVSRPHTIGRFGWRFSLDFAATVTFFNFKDGHLIHYIWYGVALLYRPYFGTDPVGKRLFAAFFSSVAGRFALAGPSPASALHMHIDFLASCSWPQFRSEGTTLNQSPVAAPAIGFFPLSAPSPSKASANETTHPACLLPNRACQSSSPPRPALFLVKFAVRYPYHHAAWLGSHHRMPGYFCSSRFLRSLVLHLESSISRPRPRLESESEILPQFVPLMSCHYL